MRYWVEMSWPEIEALDKLRTVVIFPIGSIEQHGRHLPVGTDYLLMQKLVEALAYTEIEGWTCLVTPTLQFGQNVEHIMFPGTVCLDRQTLDAVLYQQAESFRRHGFTRFIFLNAHGGNFDLLDTFVRTYKTRYNAHVENLDYFRCEVIKSEPGLLENPIGVDIHAGEFETALMQYLYPNLVHMNHPKEDLCECNVRSIQLPLGWLTHEVSRSGVMGDATLASKEKGERCFVLIVPYITGRIRAFLEKTAQL